MIGAHLAFSRERAEAFNLGGDARNEWDIRLNDEVPTALSVQMGVLVMLPDLEDPEIRPRFLGAGAREVVGTKEASLAEVLAALRRLGGEGGRNGRG